MHGTRRRFLQAVMLGFGGVAFGCASHELPAYRPPALRRPPPPIEDELRLLMVGDWGTGTTEQWDVAQGCEAVAKTCGGVHGGVFLGDNFYPSGIESADDPRLTELFENVFDTEHLGLLTWQSILGNHDHAGNAQAQIDYTARSDGRWHMPGHFYRQDFKRGGQPVLTLLALDTDQHLREQSDQCDFLADEIRKLKGADWPVVVCGHHPFVSCSSHEISDPMRKQLEPLIAGLRPSAYFCGHNHNLQLIERADTLHVISGGGGRSLHDLSREPAGTLFSARAYGSVLLRVEGGVVSLDFHGRDGRLLHSHSVEHAR